LIGFAILMGLGVWQVKRLAWKEALLAQLAERAKADPADLAAAAARAASGEDVEFLRVRFPAEYRHDAEKKMLAPYEGGQGWIIITPAVTPDGWAVIVDRGRLPDRQLDSATRPGGQVTLDGVIRTHARGKAYFDPANDPGANLWYWWDVPAMLSSSRLPDGLRPFPFVVQLVPAAAAPGFPKPEEPKATLANNHLGYAITWFGLAATLLAVAGVYVVQSRRRG
jgi:surfeit locus 1 family protein